MFPIERTQKWILSAVLDRIRQMSDFGAVVQSRLEQARKHNDIAGDKNRLERMCARFRKEVANLLEAIKVGGHISALIESLRTTQAGLAESEYQLQRVEFRQRNVAPIPDHADLVNLVEKAMQHVVDQDDQTNRLLRRLFPKVTIFPVILCNGGAVKLQAEVQFDLSAAVSALTGSEVAPGVDMETVVVNLFDTPAYVRYAEVLGTAESRNEKVLDLAEQLGIAFTTSMLARRLYRKMSELGVKNPYQRVTSPPEKGWRCRRHKHPRYQFDPCPPPERDSEAA